MKRKIIIMLSILCLTSLVIAGVGISINKELSIEEVYKDKIYIINEEPIQRNNIICDNLNGILTGSETCKQKMWKGKYKLGEVKISATKCNEFNETSNECVSYIALSDAVIKERISKAQERSLEYSAKIMIQREGNPEKKIIEDAGEITLIKKAIAIEK